MPKILLVEDDLELSQRIAAWLTSEEYAVEVIDDGGEALQTLRASGFDLVITDVGLPSLTGIDLCRKLRASGFATPILMLTGRSTVPDKINGLDSGADDYISKPVELSELSARVRALLRRPSVLVGKEILVGHIALNSQAKTVLADGTKVDLQPREFELLEFFMRHPDEYFSVESILKRLWDMDASVNEEIIYTYMTRLRKKLSINGFKCPIKTARGFGYRLERPAQ